MKSDQKSLHFALYRPCDFKILTDENPLGRHLELWELPKGDKVASSGFLFLKVLAIIISQNIFYTPQIQVHPRICQTIINCYDISGYYLFILLSLHFLSDFTSHLANFVNENNPCSIIIINYNITCFLGSLLLPMYDHVTALNHVHTFIRVSR